MTTYNIYNGQTSSGFTIESGDQLNVYGGGTTIDVNNYLGGVTIYGGGVDAGEINTEGVDYVLSGGRLENQSIVHGGEDHLNSGAVDEGGTVAWGQVYAYAGATVQGVTIAESTVSSGYAGILYVNSGAILEDVAFSGGIEVLMSGVTADGVVLSGAGLAQLWLSSGAEASDVTIGSGGYVSVNGGTLTGVTVSASGELELLSGTESNATVMSGGLEQIDGAGISIGGDMLSSGATLQFYGYNFDSAVEVIIGAASTVTSFMGETLAAGAVVTCGQYDGFADGAAAVVLSGYGISGVEIFGSGGSGTILSGASASGVIVLSGGALAFQGGASSSSIDWAGGEEIAFGGYTVSGATLEYSTNQDQALTELTLSSGGLSNEVIVSSGGVMAVCNLGVADNAVVSNGGELEVSAGGVNSGALIYKGGEILVSSGGVDVGDYLISGLEVIQAGGSATSLEFPSGAVLVDNGVLLDAADGTNRLAGRISGTGQIVESGPGTMLLAGVDTGFTGEVTISGGIAEFGAAHGPAGAVAFEAASGTTTLKLAAAATPASGGSLTNVLTDFDSAAKRLDLLATAYVSGATAVLSGDTLTLTDGTYTASFALSGDAAAKYVVASDGHSGTLIHAAVGSPIAPLAHAAAGFPVAGGPVRPAWTAAPVWFDAPFDKAAILMAARDTPEL